MAWMSKQKGKLTQALVTNTSGGGRVRDCWRAQKKILSWWAKVNNIPKSDRVV